MMKITAFIDLLATDLLMYLSMQLVLLMAKVCYQPIFNQMSIKISRCFSVELPVSYLICAWVIMTKYHVFFLSELHKFSSILLSLMPYELLTFVMLVTFLLPHKPKFLLDVLCLSWNTYSLTFISFFKSQKLFIKQEESKLKY